MHMGMCTGMYRHVRRHDQEALPANIVMANLVMAYIVMANIVMADIGMCGDMIEKHCPHVCRHM